MPDQNIQDETVVEVPDEQQLIAQAAAAREIIIDALKGIPAYTGLPALLDIALGTIELFEDEAQRINAFGFALHSLFSSITNSGLDATQVVMPVFNDFIALLSTAAETTEELPKQELV